LGPGHGPFDLRGVAHVQGGGPQPAGSVRAVREGFVQAPQAGLVEVEGRDAGAPAEQLTGDGGADAACGAGDEEVAALEIAGCGAADVGQGVHAGVSRRVGRAACGASAARISARVRLTPQRRATWVTAMPWSS